MHGTRNKGHPGVVVLSDLLPGQLELAVNHSCILTDSSPQKDSAPENVSLCSQKPHSFISRK
jgi:hypothetical protein